MNAVSCDLGRLYNKDSVIELLLKRDTFPADAAEHIRSLKDVVELQLTRKTDFQPTMDQATGDQQDWPFVCPVVGVEMNGKYRFCYIRGCGCVLSERALKEVKSESCHRCAAPFDPDADVVVINGSEEELERMRASLAQRRAKAKADKRSKKRSATSVQDDVIRLKESDACRPSSSAAAPPVAHSSSKAGDTKHCPIASDPNASEAYKSLFTTPESAKKKPKTNWVTYNPLYF